MSWYILPWCLASVSFAQNFGLPYRPDGSFVWTQPADTVILGQYGHSEPVYPSPETSGVGGWEEALLKARDFVSELTLEEKSYMVTGHPGPCVGNIFPIPRLNFSGLCLQDGPAALRDADFVSVFPSGVTIASSWDRKMMYDRAAAMGQEFKGKGAQIALAPAVGPLGRSAYSGRNWEGFSPDSYLSGVAMGETVRGFQSAGVQATAKHFLLNEQEIMRNPALGGDGFSFEAVSANADDRTIHELYLWPFANAVHEGVAAVMCSYNRINGSYACQNSKLLNGLLKGELGFQGYVMTDWYALHAGVASIEAGTDMDMPGSVLGAQVDPDTGRLQSHFSTNIVTSVNNGTIDLARLDDMITRIMTPYFFLGQDKDFPTVDPSSYFLKGFNLAEDEVQGWNLTGPTSRDVRLDHGDLIRKHAAASTILLKNEHNALPLRAPKSIGIFGNDAGDVTEGPINQEVFEFGTLAIGGGSGAGRFTSLVSPLTAIRARATEDGTYVQHWLNNTHIAASDVSRFFATPPDACLVFLKSWASEGYDREHLDLDWNANEVVESVARGCNNTIVVTHTGGINMMPFADNPNVTAIVVAHYPGEQSGNSLVDVLYGDVDPSGRLPYTIAYNATDYDFAPITTNITTNGKDDWQSYFDEKLEIDYRYFDAHNVSVRYEFGYGLSYTTFELSGLQVSEASLSAIITAFPAEQPTAPGGNPDLWVPLYNAEVTVRNTGSVTGSTVAQLYLTFPESAPAGTPIRQLRGFDKVALDAGGEAQAHFQLLRRDISYWDTEAQQWRIPEGVFKVGVGFSSRDLVEFATFQPVSENA